MLPPFIIDQIRRREDDDRRRRDYEQPQLELPIYRPAPEHGDNRPPGGEDTPERGVVILDLL